MKANIYVLTAVILWGTTFVAQREAMLYIGPHTYNALRFYTGALFIMILIWIRKPMASDYKKVSKKKYLLISFLSGFCLFGGAAFQQVGLQYTTAGNAAFLTGMYVIFVPLFSYLFFKEPVNRFMYPGILFCLAGLYFMGIDGTFRMMYGDILQLAGAVFWALYIIVVGWVSQRVTSSRRFAVIQYIVCASFSLTCALLFGETISVTALKASYVQVLYGGVLSAGVAFTLMTAALKTANTTYVAVLISFEAVVAAVSGCVILDEPFSARLLIGAFLMLTGMIFAQLKGLFPN